MRPRKTKSSNKMNTSKDKIKYKKDRLNDEGLDYNAY